MLQEMDILVETLDSVKQSNTKYLIPWQRNYVHGWIALYCYKCCHDCIL